MIFSPISAIIEDIKQGKMVILVDDEDRENEGDLIMAAQWVRPEDINFMAAYGRGLVCLTLSRERCQQLKLPLMVSSTNDMHGTNFTVSIEAAEGVTTGISAADRAVTVRKAVEKDAKPEDLVQPGHIFPIMAQPGGVLSRAGHTEAGCDLTRLAGLEPAAVIVEILNQDGSMARRDDLEIFAEQHALKMGTIADLIEYRIRNEKTVERVAECNFPTEFGDFTLISYRDNLENIVHFALQKGEVSEHEPSLVRVHMRNTLSDVLGGVRKGFPLPLRKALKVIAENGSGIVVVLSKAESADDLIKRIRLCQLEDQGGQMLERESNPNLRTNLRTYGVGAQILADLGVNEMIIIGAPKRINALAGFGLTVKEYISLNK